MKTALIIALAVAATLMLAPAAMAQNETSGVGGEAACGFGSCFTERYFAAGQAGVYKRIGGGGVVRVESADCCLGGDTLLTIVKGLFPSKGIMQYKSVAPLHAICPNAGPFLDGKGVEVRDAVKAKLKAVALPAGVPADAYIRMQGTWNRVKGTASCPGS